MLEATWLVKDGREGHVNKIEFSAANAFETLLEAKMFVDARILKARRDKRSGELHRYSNTRIIKLGYLRSHPEQALATYMEYGVSFSENDMSTDDLKVSHLREILVASGGYDHFVSLVLKKEFPTVPSDDDEDNDD